jgi:hypothetical protein
MPIEMVTYQSQDAISYSSFLIYLIIIKIKVENFEFKGKAAYINF